MFRNVSLGVPFINNDPEYMADATLLLANMFQLVLCISLKLRNNNYTSLNTLLFNQNELEGLQLNSEKTVFFKNLYNQKIIAMVLLGHSGWLSNLTDNIGCVHTEVTRVFNLNTVSSFLFSDCSALQFQWHVVRTQCYLSFSYITIINAMKMYKQKCTKLYFVKIHLMSGQCFLTLPCLSL